jgi:hypothetical protein
MRFVANDLCGCITIFWVPLFSFFPTRNPRNKACCNVVKNNLQLIFREIILEVVGHVYVS